MNWLIDHTVRALVLAGLITSGAGWSSVQQQSAIVPEAVHVTVSDEPALPNDPDDDEYDRVRPRRKR